MHVHAVRTSFIVVFEAVSMHGTEVVVVEDLTLRSKECLNKKTR